MAELDSTRRFSGRAAQYARYRPSYPADVLQAMATDGAIRGPVVVADIGSGTGLLSALLLDAGHRVLAVEPNAEMRLAAERTLGAHPGFTSIAGRAEATTLDASSVDVVAAAQAFHWFDVESARREFARVLRPRGLVLLVWNDRDVGAGPFMADYEGLLARHGTDYARVNHQKTARERVERLFGPAGFRERFALLDQTLDFDGLRGRLLSSSFVPAPGAAGHPEMMADLAKLFGEHACDGRVVMSYRTRIYTGHLAPREE